MQKWLSFHSSCLYFAEHCKPLSIRQFIKSNLWKIHIFERNIHKNLKKKFKKTISISSLLVFHWNIFIRRISFFSLGFYLFAQSLFLHTGHIKWHSKHKRIVCFTSFPLIKTSKNTVEFLVMKITLLLKKTKNERMWVVWIEIKAKIRIKSVFSCQLSSHFKGCAGLHFDGPFCIPVTLKAPSITAHYPGRERTRGDPQPSVAGLTETQARLNTNRATRLPELCRCQKH